MVATPDWLAIVDDEISLRLSPSVLAQIDLDTQGLATNDDRHAIIYKVNSQKLLQVLASSVGMASLRQGAIVIWTYYNDNIGNSSQVSESPILRTLISIDGDLSQKVCQDILKHPQSDRILKAHSFLVGQISRQFVTAIADYIEEKLRPFAIAIISFVTTVTWYEPLQNINKRFDLSANLIAPLANQRWLIAIAAPITVLMVWGIYANLNLKLPTLPRNSQKIFTKLLKLLERQISQVLAIAVVLTLFLGWVAIQVAIPIDNHWNNLIITIQSYLELYLPIAIVSLRKSIVSGLGPIFLRYPFFVKLIFGRFIR
ncbi:MAG: hypothetical protein LH649_01680 [Pseudanabaena sp. CAN_BIN31]|nr:hypothetical protein [Pseudanabaena sp. CAN_BIN31]